jgi:CTP:molybdopterin cytidylyltransferase MocA
MPRSPALVVLAAGAGTRFDGPTHKLSSRLPATGSDPAETVLERSVRHAVQADAGPVIVVVGATDHPLGDDLRGHVAVHRNPAWAEGQATSLQAAIDAARAGGHDAIVVGLADQPGIAPDAWRLVAAAPGPIAVATYDGRRANPVRLDDEIWHLLPTSGDEGARTLMRVRPELVVAVPCSGSPADIDTEEDLRRWQSN